MYSGLLRGFLRVVFAAVFVNSGSEKTSSYKEAAESKYSLGNFVDLSDYEAERSDNELYSNGFLSGYYTVDNYSKSDGSYNYYTATVYEYTGGTAASRKLIKKRLEKELLRETSVGGKSIKYTDGTEGDYRYKYCNYTDKFEMRSSSYFSIVAESSDKVTVYILNSDYKIISASRLTRKNYQLNLQLILAAFAAK